MGVGGFRRVCRWRNPAPPRRRAALIAQGRFFGGGAVAIVGSGSRCDWQPLLPPAALAISTLGFPATIDLHAENLTASISVGIVTGRGEAAAGAGRFLAAAPARGDPEASLGGCLAAGFSNPLRLGYGLPRDWVLGLDVTSGTGQSMKLGGGTA